ncbi:hypothetical protein N780_08820 [Pontibacillus chungwhensis BH030062]|uniref:Uncharacterized protein n=1 Tax=Pontibacillus chungwhensis BH030062 TaxID=1385513 RepID=A0A0A2UTY2_9BACI|nr:hypothetical protein [Pontibacillus chungwhensis]KGP91339.1 hypothetical protein N780_08820 [Pontibacillus chungwhensis BH030062]
MSKNKKIENNLTALIFLSIAFTMLGIGGVISLINLESTFDIIIGIAQTFGLVVGGIGFYNISLAKSRK